MRTEQHPRIHRTRQAPIADHVAKRVTNDLYQYLGSAVEVGTVVDMYEWVRAGNVSVGELNDLALVARRWNEHRRHTDHSDWLRRAFGD